MADNKQFKRVEETDARVLALIKQLLKYGAMEDEDARAEIERILKELEKYMSKAQIDMLIKRLQTRITWEELSDSEQKEILG